MRLSHAALPTRSSHFTGTRYFSSADSSAGNTNKTLHSASCLQRIALTHGQHVSKSLREKGKVLSLQISPLPGYKVPKRPCVPLHSLTIDRRGSFSPYSPSSATPSLQIILLVCIPVEICGDTETWERLMTEDSSRISLLSVFKELT